MTRLDPAPRRRRNERPIPPREPAGLAAGAFALLVPLGLLWWEIGLSSLL